MRFDPDSLLPKLLKALPLSTRQKLEQAASLTLQLGLDEIDPRQINLRLQQLRLQNETLTNQITLLQESEKELTQLNQSLDKLQEELDTTRNIFSELKEMQEPDTVDTINLKCEEYQKRFGRIKQPQERLAQVEEFIEYVEGAERWYADRQKYLAIQEEFCGLPPNVREARAILEREEAELDALLKERDQLLAHIHPKRMRH